jgi:myo-inositol-1(or 4)-monophosphatase
MLVKVAGEAAAYLRDHFGADELLHVAHVHKHDSDEGLRVDVESERNIVELLRAEGFRGVFVGEEYGVVKLGDEDLVVVADPLDGSKNYAGLIPWCAVSLAAAPKGATVRDVVAGAIAPVFRWPVLSFARGVGAFEGARRVHTERTYAGSKLVLAYVERMEQAEAVLRYLQLSGGQRSVRALGSASLEIAWVGMGRAEAFIDVRGKLRTVDVAAAIWFAAEAGALVAVEKLEAPIETVGRVGSVVAASTREAWSKLAEALGGMRNLTLLKGVDGEG